MERIAQHCIPQRGFEPVAAGLEGQEGKPSAYHAADNGNSLLEEARKHIFCHLDAEPFCHILYYRIDRPLGQGHVQQLLFHSRSESLGHGFDGFIGACRAIHYAQAYGSVVDEIDDNHVRQIAFPLLKDKSVQQRINDLALEANAKRYEAYNLEQEALRTMNDEVIYAK